MDSKIRVSSYFIDAFKHAEFAVGRRYSRTGSIGIGTANPTSVLDLGLIRACMASSERLPKVG
jgi:hypothetical protein